MVTVYTLVLVFHLVNNQAISSNVTDVYATQQACVAAGKSVEENLKPESSAIQVSYVCVPREVLLP